MPRFLLLMVLALPLLAVACGGDDDEPEASSTPGEATQAPTRTPLPVRPTPGPRTDDATAFAVGVPGKDPFLPTVAEVKELPRTDVAGESGITLAALAEAAGVEGEPSFVSIEGTTKDNRRTGTVRYAWADVSTSTILVPDDQGHFHIASTFIPEAERLNFVASVAFQ